MCLQRTQAIALETDRANDPSLTCFEVLSNLGTNVQCIGRFACGLLVDALEVGTDCVPLVAVGPVGADGVPLVAVGGDAADVPLGIYHCPQSTVGVRRCRRGRVRAFAFA